MGRTKKVKDKPAAKAPAGWTEEQWLAEQQAWKDDPYGPLLWATTLNLKNERGDPMEWHDRRFLVDIFCDMHPRQVIVKCTQVGLSTIMIFKAIFAALIYALGIIYTLPTYKLLLEFYKTKIERLIENNPNIAPTGDSNIGIMTYDKAGFALFRGTMGDSQDVSLTSDLNIHDERDKSDDDVCKGMVSRLMASKYGGRWEFTNPTRPNVGTDLLWQQSDKRMWHVTCPHCQEEQTLDRWENIQTVTWVDEEKRERKRSFYACRRCGQEWENDKEVRRNGHWKATNPDPDAKWHGYHLNQLCAPWISAEQILEFEQEMTKEKFYNFVLGLPVIGEGISVERSLIMQNVVPEGDPRWEQSRKSAKKFLGVDVGKQLHCIISNEAGMTKIVALGDDPDITPKERESFDSLKSKWGKLDQLMRLEQITLAVIDNGPASKQVEFQKRFPYKVYRCIYDYNDKRKEDYEVNREVGVVHAHRTRVIDKVLDEHARGLVPIFMRADDPWLDGTGKGSGENCLTHHWESFYQVGLDGSDENIVKKDRTGNVIRTWENAGPDHFGHANVYNRIATWIGTPLGGGSSFLAGSAGGSTGRSRADDDEDEEDKPSVSFYNT